MQENAKKKRRDGVQIPGRDDERRAELISNHGMMTVHRQAEEARKAVAAQKAREAQKVLDAAKAAGDRQAEEDPPLLGLTTAHQAEEARKRALEAQKVVVLEARKHANQKARQALEARQADEARKLAQSWRELAQIPFF